MKNFVTQEEHSVLLGEIKKVADLADAAAKTSYKVSLDNQNFHRETKESLDRIETQTILHNGRLKKVETQQAFIQGGLAVVTLLLVPIILFMVYQLLTPKVNAKNTQSAIISK